MSITNVSARVGKELVVDLDMNLDDYHVAIKCAFEIISFGCVIYSTFALIALQKTKTTPETARFLTGALITYDIIAVVCFNVRKFITNPEWNTMIQVLGVSFCCLALVTIGLMSLERLVIFYSPYFYLRYINASRVKKAAITFWAIYFASYWLVRVLVCALVFPPFSYLNLIGICNGINFVYYGGAIGFVCLSAVLCNLKIFLIIRKELTQTCSLESINPSKASLRYLRTYKSTSLVFGFGITSIASAIMYAIIILLDLERIPLRLSTDAVNTFCCMMDPLMYAIWYRECRMEMLKLVTFWIPSFAPRVEAMRRDVFHIT